MKIIIFTALFIFSSSLAFANQELIDAAKDGDINKIERLLQPGSDVDVNFRTPGFYPMSALHLAALYGRTLVVHSLIAHGASVDLFNYNGDTALHLAAVQGWVETLNALISYGANIDLRAHLGDTALQLAAENKQLGTLSALISHGAAIDRLNWLGFTALQCAASQGHTEVAAVLISGGADIHLSNRYGSSALHSAAGNGRLDMVNLLISHGADVDFANDRGETAFLLAVEYDHPAVVESLILHGSDIDRRDRNGKTALHFAAAGQHISVLKVLISHGADMHLSTPEGFTALELAKRWHPVNDLASRIIQSVLDKRIPQPGDSEFTIAIKEANLSQVKSLLRSGIQVTPADLQLAQDCKYPKIVHCLNTFPIRILENRSFQYIAIAREKNPSAISLPENNLWMIREYLFGRSSFPVEEHLEDLGEP